MAATFTDVPGYPHAETTLDELRQLSATQEEPLPDPDTAAFGTLLHVHSGHNVRRAYFAHCLKVDGSLTVQVYADGHPPRLPRRFSEADEEDRGQVVLPLITCLPDLTLEDIVKRIFIR